MNKKGFTLIELLAVIIILGILMIIAIPSVTRYISDSRKNAYVDTAKEIVGGARNLVNDGKLEMYDTDVTYYIESSCIKTENASKSPYGEFTKAYVVVTYDGKGYTYYWTSNDDAGQGIKNVVRIDKLDTDNVESDLKDSDISTLRGIDGRSKTVVISKENGCIKEGSNDAEYQVNGETSEESEIITAAKEILETANESDQLNQIPETNIYIFKGGNPANYVSFNGESWRIIGIYGKQLKIQRVGAPSGLTSVRWSLASPTPGWATTTLNTNLNDTYYNTLTDQAKNMIDPNGTWYIGAPSWDATGQAAYNSAKNKKWNGKVGIMTSYEYLFASGIDGCSNISGAYGYFDTTCGKKINNWMTPNSNSWSMSSFDGDIIALDIRSEGHVRFWHIQNFLPAIPAVILKSNVKIVSGGGLSPSSAYVVQ